MADAAKLEQEYLQHCQDMQTEMSLADSHLEHEQAVSPLLALQSHASSEPQAGNPVQPLQVMWHRQQPALLKGKDEGIWGILSRARLPSSRVAPVDAMLAVCQPGQHTDNTYLMTGVEHAVAKPKAPVRAPQVGHTNCHDGNTMAFFPSQLLLRAAKHDRHRQLSLHAALQQSNQQVKASITHLELMSIQQQAMQKALESLIANCHIVHEHILQMQQQKTST